MRKKKGARKMTVARKTGIGRRRPIYTHAVSLNSPEGEALFNAALEKLEKELLADPEKARAFIKSISPRDDEG